MKIKINNYDWELMFVDSTEEEIPNSLGVCIYTKLIIKVRKNLPSKLERDTIMHEITHAYIFSYGFDKESYTNEELTCFLTQNAENIIALTEKCINKRGIIK